MGELREQHDREWFKPQFKVTFIYDYFDNDFLAHQIKYELINVKGENAEREMTTVKSSTSEEREAVKEMMAREIQDQFINDDFIPYPRLKIINPTYGQVISGTLQIQIEVKSEPLGDFVVAFSTGEGWSNCPFNSSSGYYEKSADSAEISNGEYQFEARALKDGIDLLAEIDISVDN